MPPSLILETELPGRRVNLDTFQIISHRYYWCSRYISGKSVLEVGCGPGFGLGYLSRFARQMTAGDITSESLAIAEKHYRRRINFARMDGHHMPFKDRDFDVIICVASVIYMDMPVILKEFRRVIKDSGQLLLNTPNKDIPGFQPSQMSRKYYSVPEWNALFQDNRFQAQFSGAFKISSLINKLWNKIKQPRRITLSNELSDQDLESVKGIPLTPLANEINDTKHRIVYMVAQKL